MKGHGAHSGLLRGRVQVLPGENTAATRAFDSSVATGQIRRLAVLLRPTRPDEQLRRSASSATAAASR